MTLTAQIASLIDKQDNCELVRDQIGAILLLEQASQQALATAAAKDPKLWELRIFTEASNPFEQWIDLDENTVTTAVTSPIVNVWFENDAAIPGASDTVERQKLSGTFNVDCYGVGISRSSGSGHKPGDQEAAKEAQRAARLVRNILMAGAWTYLGMRGVVAKRWVASRASFQPSLDKRPVQHVQGVRVAFQVDFLEFSPQVQAQTLELISVEVHRDTVSGQLLLTADFPQT